MEGKLHEYIRHMQEEADIKAEELKEKPLFEGRAIEDLHAMSISFGRYYSNGNSKKIPRSQRPYRIR